MTYYIDLITGILSHTPGDTAYGTFSVDTDHDYELVVKLHVPHRGWHILIVMHPIVSNMWQTSDKTTQLIGLTQEEFDQAYPIQLFRFLNGETEPIHQELDGVNVYYLTLQPPYESGT